MARMTQESFRSTTSRILQVGDFIPDFEFSNDRQTVHSAALGGQQWTLVILQSPDIVQQYPELEELFRGEFAEHMKPWVVALSSSALTHQKVQAAGLFHANDGERLRRIFLGSDENNENLGVFTVDHAQKVIRRMDCHPKNVLRTIEALATKPAMDGGEPAPVAIPALKVPSALPAEFCKALVQRHRGSDQKVQGRSGLSSPTLDESVKRVVHINADAELGKSIDRILVFSLLPAIERVFDYRVSHRVAYKISAYSAEQHGFFAAHRDNSDAGTTFRRFALSICLNDDWAGGGICFPEYSPTPVPQGVGDALVFPASLMHKVEAIQEGERFVLLSFLYDKQGAETRRARMENPEILEEKYIDSIEADTLRAYDDFAPKPRFCPQYSRVK